MRSWRRGVVGAVVVVGLLLVGYAALVSGHLSSTPGDSHGSDASPTAVPQHPPHARPPAWQNAPRASIAGTVTNEARVPLAGARVCAVTESAALPRSVRRVAHCVTTDPGGAYVLSELYAAEYGIRAAADHYVPSQVEPFAVVAGEQRTGVEVTLRGGAVEITGTVTDLGGGPIAHAEVSAFPSTTYQSSAPVETDDAGTYHLWVAPGRGGVSAAADGYAPDTAFGLAPGTFDLVLTPESVVAGTVIEAQTHRPVPEAVVTLQRSTSKEFGDPRDIDEETTDEEGRFRFDRLSPDRYSERAVAPHGAGRSNGSVALGLGQAVDNVVVEVQPAARLEGHILIAGTPDRPCPGGSLRLTNGNDDDERWGGAPTAGTVSVDGISPGTYRLSVDCAGYELPGERPQIVIGTQDLSLTWRLSPANPRSTLRGHIRTRTGAAVSAAVVELEGLRCVSGADGSYELTDLEAGTFELHVESDAGVSPEHGWTVLIPAHPTTVTQNLTLEAGGTIAGLVTDTEGKPAAHVTVDLGGADSTPGVDGAFQFANLRPRSYTVTVRGPDGEVLASQAIAVRADHVSTTRLAVTTASASIAGVVVDAAGRPLGDAFVVAGHEQNGHADTHPWSVHAGNQVLAHVDGTFEFAHLLPGAYTLRAYRSGGGEVVVAHVATGTRARLTILPTGTIAGTVHTPAGAPVTLTIDLVSANGEFSQQERFSRTEGRFHFDGIPAGEYLLTATADGREGRAEVRLREGEHITGVELSTDGAVTLVGRLLDLETKLPVPDAEVRAALTGRSHWHRAPTGPDGRFVITDIPLGALQIRIGGAEFHRAPSAGGVVDLGDLWLAKRRVAPGADFGFFGIQFAANSPDVIELVPGSPASKVGLAVGDRVIAIDGIDITPAEGTNGLELLYAPPGTTFQLGLARGATVTITTVERL